MSQENYEPIEIWPTIHAQSYIFGEIMKLKNKPKTNEKKGKVPSKKRVAKFVKNAYKERMGSEVVDALTTFIPEYTKMLEGLRKKHSKK